MKFLIINPFGIGDVLFTTPAIKAIKDSLPDAIISYWCNERVEGFLKNNLNIDKIFALSRGDLKRIYQEEGLAVVAKFLKLIFGLKKERFEVSLDFSCEHRYSLIAKLLGIRRRIGFNYKGRGRFLTDRIDLEGYNSKHIVEYYLDLLKPLNIKPKTYNLDLGVAESNKISAANILRRFRITSQDSLIGIAPGAGASWGKDASLKHWMPLRYAQLIDKIADAFGLKVLILGDASERPIADVIVNASSHKPIDLIGKTTLGELVAIINELHLLITNDGGPLHIAVALGKKTVSIFGPVDERVYGPYPKDKSHIVIKRDLACRPCYQNFRLAICVDDRQCIKDISVEEVFEAVRSLL